MEVFMRYVYNEKHMPLTPENFEWADMAQNRLPNIVSIGIFYNFCNIAR